MSVNLSARWGEKVDLPCLAGTWTCLSLYFNTKRPNGCSCAHADLISPTKDLYTTDLALLERVLGEREEFTRVTVKFCKLLTRSGWRWRRVRERRWRRWESKGFDFRKGKLEGSTAQPTPTSIVLECRKQNLLTPAFAPSLVKTVETSDVWARLMAIYLTGLIEFNFAGIPNASKAKLAPLLLPKQFRIPKPCSLDEKSNTTMQNLPRGGWFIG